MKSIMHHRASAFVLLAALIFSDFDVRAEPRLDVFSFSSRTLKSNPLRDPATRQVAVFLPTQYSTNTPLPIVYYLPGYGGGAEGFIKEADKWRALTQQIADEVAPVLFVVVDGRNRWGGSQFINSASQGNYADYICDEIVSQVESRYGITTNKLKRIIAGHSSGGFGALRLGMFRPKLFDGVIALSPDSDFQLSHLHLMKRAGVTNISLAQVKIFADPNYAGPTPEGGALKYALGLSAAYAPRGWWHRGQFDWIFDSHGHFREKVWQHWLDNDPLTLVQKNRDAFLPNQSIYVEGPTLDSYKANVGARKIYEVLRERPARCTFYEPPGKHSDRVPERLERALAWLFDRPMQDIQ